MKFSRPVCPPLERRVLDVQADGTLRPRPAGPNNLFVPARSSQAVTAVAPGGVIRFQCCIHPWMRTELRVR